MNQCTSVPLYQRAWHFERYGRIYQKVNENFVDSTAESTR